MKKNMINILLFIILFFGCTKKNDGSTVSIQKITNAELPNSVSITFVQKPEIDSIFYITPTILSNPDKIISFFDGTPIVSNKLQNKLKKYPQNLRLEVKNEYIILRIHTNALDTNDYLIQKGDSVEVKFLNKKPFVTILNRNTMAFDYTIEDLINVSAKSEKYSIFGQLSDVPTLYLQKIFNDKKLKTSLSSLNPEQKMKRKKEIESEMINDLSIIAKPIIVSVLKKIDSLNQKELLSKSQYLFYHNKYSIIKDILDVENNILTIDKIQEQLNYSNISSEIYKDIYYQKFLESIEDKYILPKTNYMNLGDFVNKDYRMAYNLVNESVFLKNQNRNYLLYREIDRIAKSFSNKDFLEYFARFEKDVADTTYINHIRNKYSLKFNDKKNETNSLVLMSSDKKQITFDDLKKRHVGKLIYVDFWASWCAPCRKALPFSIKIKDKNKDVVFVYLSIDSTIDPWQKAMIDENLDNYSESYLIVNSESSSFLKKQNVSAIPRYMIFDRRGTLAFANAPSAESKELESTFAKLLK